MTEDISDFKYFMSAIGTILFVLILSPIVIPIVLIMCFYDAMVGLGKSMRGKS